MTTAEKTEESLKTLCFEVEAALDEIEASLIYIEGQVNFARKALRKLAK